MVKNIGILIFCLFLHGFIFAQQIHFRVVNIQTGLPIEAVKVTSLPEHRFISYSTTKGAFTQFVAQDDTLELSKDGFHPLLLKIMSNNFDSAHAVTIGMVPLEKKTGKIPKEYKSLESFEYHFVHDTLGESSQMKVNVLENVQAVQQRSKNRDQSFKIGAVDIDSPPSIDDPKRTYKSHYRLLK